MGVDGIALVAARRDGKLTVFSTGDAMASPDTRRGLLQLLFGPHPQ
ncbi:hypothetical protein GZL_05917 [Streptomyces sp. 769]|nr:hypothetical protein GZL_05917 [Streptomyces sp. 769]